MLKGLTFQVIFESMGISVMYIALNQEHNTGGYLVNNVTLMHISPEI